MDEIEEVDEEFGSEHLTGTARADKNKRNCVQINSDSFRFIQNNSSFLGTSCNVPGWVLAVDSCSKFSHKPIYLECLKRVF
jgi:hypothetical protein